MKPEDLSFRAYGLLVYLWQTLDEKPFKAEDIPLYGTTRMAVDKAIRELVAGGYIKQAPQGRNKKGQYRKPKYQIKPRTTIQLGMWLERKDPDYEDEEDPQFLCQLLD